MLLIYKDPFGSGLQVKECRSEKDIPKILENDGITEDCAECIYWVFVSAQGEYLEGCEDYT